LLLATDNKARTVFRWAAESDKLEILHEICEWAKVKLSVEEINKFLLVTDCDANTCHLKTTFWGGIEILLKIWEWANENRTTQEIKNKLLLATDNRLTTVFR